MKRFPRTQGLALLALLALAPASGEAAEVVAREAWIREAPPVSQVLAGYLRLENRGATPASLVGAAGAAFGRVEIHETIMKDGQASMQAVKNLAIPPGGQISLEPGGLHLMLIAPQGPAPLKAGNQVPLTLAFDDGSRLEVTFEVHKTHQNAGEDPHQGHGPAAPESGTGPSDHDAAGHGGAAGH
ncbi:MAG: copper chaperone PCu(A)C [Magnetococcales bacterium]|nr:copper chaperone PCu(A)C [Magnetococcales bacterium]